MTWNHAKSKWSVILFLTIPGMVSAQAKPLHWDDCFQAAIKKNETIANQDELIYQANERNKQAKGAIFPTISGGISRSQVSAPTTVTHSAIENEGFLAGSQPLFDGLRISAGINQTKSLIASAEQTKKRTMVQLYQAVVTAFYQIIAAEKDIENLESEAKLYDKQIAQLKSWLKIGRSRKADLSQTQSEQSQLLASVEISRNQLDTARETLAYLTGLDRNIAIEDSLPEHFIKDLGTLDDYVKAVEDRPEVLAAAYNRDAAKSAITVARGGHLPTFNVSGDYYIWRTGFGPNGPGEGSWDFLLYLSIPIFQGGVVQSQVRVANSLARQNELLLSQNKRLADQEIRTYFQRVQDDENGVKTLGIAKDLAWQSYQEELHDYKMAMITNIDVLQSLTNFTTDERTLDQLRYQKRIDYLNLLAASGKVKEIPYGE